MYCTALHCAVLYCTVLYCDVLYYGVLWCDVLWCTALYCIIPNGTPTRLTNYRCSRSQDASPKGKADARSLACHPCRTVLVQHSTAQHSTIQHNTLLHYYYAL